MHPLKQLSNKRKVGIYSACTGNELVIEAVLKKAKKSNTYALIESTSNQVNQYGGYTGMTPSDYRDFVFQIADKIGLQRDRIILGGDHLGPLLWTELDEENAMKKAEKLVCDYILAGFTKIHLDTSMKLRDDTDLSDELIARRSMRLAKSCEQAYEELKKINSEAIFPVFIVGSEVPIPGGAQEEETIVVTTTDALKKTYETFKTIFNENGVEKTFNNIISVVVQPGVEFGDSEIERYDQKESKKLIDYLRENYETLTFEGHSTDYQTREDMRAMVNDGIAILKVGPGLTFALREALFNLELTEKAMNIESSSNFSEILDEHMLANPIFWLKHYHGTAEELAQKRKYSFSDRSRYYLNEKEVETSINKLLNNFDDNPIPINILSQFFPLQYREVINGKLSNNGRDIVQRHVEYTIDDYLFATEQELLG